jgi:hypothetical protein
MAKLFEQGSDVEPDLTFRLASGLTTNPTENHTWQTIVIWLEGVLGFLKTSLNLSDLNDKPAARTNLDVYSTGEIDTELDLKADKTNVLEKDNTTTYTPLSDYNPATKKYADAPALKTDTFNSGGGDTTAYDIRARQRGSVVSIHGTFDINGTDGTIASPLLVAAITSPTIDPPVTLHNFGGGGTESDGAAACRGYVIGEAGQIRVYITCATDASQVNSFSTTYLI